MATDRIEDFNEAIEDLFLQFLYTDSETFVRVKNIISSDYFDDPDNRKIVQFLIDYTDNHTAMPTDDQVKAITGKKVEKIDEINEEHVDWFLGNFERFCQQKAAKKAVYESIDLIGEDKLGEVVEKIKQAAELGIVKDLGTDYFLDPVTRLQEIRDKSNMISTGWRDIDRRLYGGLEKGSLTIWAGQSGAGKSLFLQNQALNWVEQGLNVVYLSLELSEKLCSMRIDAMTTGYSTKEILKNIEDVNLKIQGYRKTKKAGTLQIKQLPNGSTANDIRAYIKEYETQKKIKVDAILIDYLDLCFPTNKRINPSDLFVKDKYVSEELRNIAVDLNVLLVTASQLNRSSHDEIEFDHSHIAGGISKINTADNVFGIFTTLSMREAGRYQIQLMKTRSSAGVGAKIDLKFNLESLRILDLDESEDGADTATAKNILDSLQRQNVVKDNKKNSAGADKSQVKALRDLVRKHNI